jgi:hypothetical protein
VSSAVGIAVTISYVVRSGERVVICREQGDVVQDFHCCRADDLPVQYVIAVILHCFVCVADVTPLIVLQLLLSFTRSCRTSTSTRLTGRTCT